MLKDVSRAALATPAAKNRVNSKNIIPSSSLGISCGSNESSIANFRFGVRFLPEPSLRGGRFLESKSKYSDGLLKFYGKYIDCFIEYH